MSTIRCEFILGFSELTKELGESEAVGRLGLALHIVEKERTSTEVPVRLPCPFHTC